LDANVLVYAVDVDAGSRHTIANDVMNRARAANTALTEQAIFEFFHAATRKGKMPLDDAAAIAKDLARNFRMLQAHTKIVESALDLRSRYSLNIWDARLLAICDAHGCDHLLSEDLQDGAQYNGVTVVNPFNASNAGLIGQLLS
jgi:predicted nucleic acid-binding protein